MHLQGSHWPGKPGKVREKNCGQGKVSEFYFLSWSQGKVRDFFQMPISMKICCFCRWSIMMVTVFTNMKVHMWIFNNIFIVWQVLHQQHLKYNTDIIWNELFQTLRFVWYIYSEISLEVREKSGKIGICFQIFCGNPESYGRKLYRYLCNVSSCFRNTGWSTFNGVEHVILCND